MKKTPQILFGSRLKNQYLVFEESEKQVFEDDNRLICYLFTSTAMRGHKDPTPQGPVLLVCIYNQFGNIITHDYLYQLFCPHGTIIKILIFQKAKVWKAFVQYDKTSEAEKALHLLNNKIIFEDGSKMNIFRSKLKHVQFQNDNLGGVNYQALKMQQEQEQVQEEMPNRRRRSTFQDYIAPFYTHEPMVYNMMDKQSTYSSNSHKFKSETKSPVKQYQNQNSSLSNFMDIDQQFREIALESQEFREWNQIAQTNRKKSKTIVNPNSEQFLQQNCPSKVLFARSLPEHYDHDCLYNIFSNFGKVTKVIFIREKNSALIQFDTLMSSIQAKDEINYAKPNFKVFYSHYESLVLKKITNQQEQFEYKSEGPSRPPNPNPPSEVLYMTMVHPKMENEIRQLCESLGCFVKEMEWKQNNKDKWMCLVEFSCLTDSLYAMGRLQGHQLSGGKKIRLSFTRSKLRKYQGSPGNKSFELS